MYVLRSTVSGVGVWMIAKDFFRDTILEEDCYRKIVTESMSGGIMSSARRSSSWRYRQPEGKAFLGSPLMGLIMLAIAVGCLARYFL